MGSVLVDWAAEFARRNQARGRAAFIILMASHAARSANEIPDGILQVFWILMALIAGIYGFWRLIDDDLRARKS